MLYRQAPTGSVRRSMVNRAMSWQPTRLPSSRGSKQSATVKINGLLHTKDEVQVCLCSVCGLWFLCWFALWAVCQFCWFWSSPLRTGSCKRPLLLNFCCLMWYRQLCAAEHKQAQAHSHQLDVLWSCCAHKVACTPVMAMSPLNHSVKAVAYCRLYMTPVVAPALQPCSQRNC